MKSLSFLSNALLLSIGACFLVTSVRAMPSRLTAKIHRHRKATPPSFSPSSFRLLAITADNNSEHSRAESSSSSQEDQPEEEMDWRDQAVDWDWQTMAQDVFREDKRPVVLFDGVCNLCNSGVNFAMDQDQEAKLRFCSLQSRVAQSLLLREGRPPHQQQISFITESRGHFSSDAVSHICMHLDSQPLQWFGTLGQYTPDWIRESLYQVVSKNRQVMGKSDQCRIDFDGTYTSRFVSDPLDEGYTNYTI